MKLLKTLTLLVEQTEDYLVVPKIASDELSKFIAKDEGVNGKVVLFTYDDAYYNDPPIEYDSSGYKKG